MLTHHPMYETRARATQTGDILREAQVSHAQKLDTWCKRLEAAKRLPTACRRAAQQRALQIEAITLREESDALRRAITRFNSNVRDLGLSGIEVRISRAL